MNTGKYIINKYLIDNIKKNQKNEKNEKNSIIEYTNILSFDTIYFQPLIAMFHDMIGFTVVLYED